MNKSGKKVVTLDWGRNSARVNKSKSENNS